MAELYSDLTDCVDVDENFGPEESPDGTLNLPLHAQVLSLLISNSKVVKDDTQMERLSTWLTQAFVENDVFLGIRHFVRELIKSNSIHPPDRLVLGLQLLKCLRSNGTDLWCDCWGLLQKIANCSQWKSDASVRCAWLKSLQSCIRTTHDIDILLKEKKAFITISMSCLTDTSIFVCQAASDLMAHLILTSEDSLPVVLDEIFQSQENNIKATNRKFILIASNLEKHSVDALQIIRAWEIIMTKYNVVKVAEDEFCGLHPTDNNFQKHVFSILQSLNDNDLLGVEDKKKLKEIVCILLDKKSFYEAIKLDFCACDSDKNMMAQQLLADISTMGSSFKARQNWDRPTIIKVVNCCLELILRLQIKRQLQFSEYIATILELTASANHHDFTIRAIQESPQTLILMIRIILESNSTHQLKQDTCLLLLEQHSRSHIPLLTKIWELVKHVSRISLLDNADKDKLVKIFHRGFCDLKWEVRDCTLEAIKDLCSVEKQVNQELLKEALPGAQYCLEDGSSFVQASALALVSSVLRNGFLWVFMFEKKSRNEVAREIVDKYLQHPEAVVRRAALRTLMEFINIEESELTKDVSNSVGNNSANVLDSTDMKSIDRSSSHFIYEAFIQVLNDIDWDVKCSLLDFWFAQLKSSIESEDTTKLQERLEWHANCGCFRSLLVATKDHDQCVKRKACQILLYLQSASLPQPSSSMDAKRLKLDHLSTDASMPYLEFFNQLSNLDLQSMAEQASLSIDQYDKDPNKLLEDILYSFNCAVQTDIDCY